MGLFGVPSMGGFGLTGDIYHMPRNNTRFCTAVVARPVYLGLPTVDPAVWRANCKHAESAHDRLQRVSSVEGPVLDARTGAFTTSQACGTLGS